MENNTKCLDDFPAESCDLPFCCFQKLALGPSFSGQKLEPIPLTCEPAKNSKPPTLSRELLRSSLWRMRSWQDLIQPVECHRTSSNPETQIRLTCFRGTFDIKPGVENNSEHTLTGWLTLSILGNSSSVEVKIPSAVQVFNPQTPAVPSISSLSTHEAFLLPL